MNIYLRDGDWHVETLRRDVRIGFDAVERGEFTEYDEGNIKDLSDRIKARGRNRLVEEDLKIVAK